jgi:hypothetical protein
MTATTWRADLVAAHLAILRDQITATPTLLRKAYSSQPGSFGELPLAYIGNRPETLRHDAGTRTRTIAIEVILVDNYSGDNVQGGDRLDQLVDALVDRYDIITNVQRVGSSIIELTSINDADVEVPGTDRTLHYRGVSLTFGNTAKLEGRQ